MHYKRQHTVCTFLILLIFTFDFAIAQQVPDTLYSPPYFEPLIKNGPGPVVYVDEAHTNFHTIGDRYKPFANLLRKAGFTVKPLNSSPGKGLKADARILVISNAISAEDDNDWNLPNRSAFTAKEISAINAWVKNGGSLFIIADHMPFAAAAADLAASFGFTFYDCFAMDSLHQNGYDLFTRDNESLAAGELTKGIDTIATFTGQGFESPAQAIPILTLNKDFRLLLPERAWVFDEKTKRLPGKGKSQLAVLKYGKGKVVVSGEAAMFTAQLNGNKKVGMNTAAGKKNYLLLLNLMQWLNSPS